MPRVASIPAMPARGLLLSTVAAVAVTVALALWYGSRPVPSYAQGPGRYYVREGDFSFSPDSLVWRVGQRVSLTLVDDATGNPPRTHEFMAGRGGPRAERNAFGELIPTGGFRTDFFKGVTVSVSRTSKVTMLMSGLGVQVAGPAAKAPFVMQAPAAGGGAMPGMSMPGMSMPGMSMPGAKKGGGAMPGMQMPAAGGETQADGFMLVLDPGGAATLTFTVPDKPGRWEFGCFRQDGQHYLNGMKGTITVVRS